MPSTTVKTPDFTKGIKSKGKSIPQDPGKAGFYDKVVKALDEVLTSDPATSETYSKKTVAFEFTGDGKLVKIEWKGNKCLPDHVKVAVGCKQPPNVDPADTWENAVCKSGTTVFHNTKKKEHAISIATDGIKKVKNLWGGGALGQGFYTHKSAKSASLYGSGRFTLMFTVTGPLKGKVVPRGVIGRGIDKEGGDYAKGNDFLTNEDDRDEYKFHSGKNLKITCIIDLKMREKYDDLAKFINAMLDE